MTKRKINLAIAEDHTLVLQGYMAMLKNHAKLKVMLVAANGRELIQKLSINKPDIVILDIEMPVLDGREAMAQLKKKYPKIKIIVVTSHYHEAFMLEFIKNGACAFLPKNCEFEDLENAILKVSKDGVYFTEDVNRVLSKSVATQSSVSDNNLLKERYTKTELKIIRMLCEQKTVKEVAVALQTKTNEIDWLLQAILRRAECDNVPALLKYAVENELV